ncbi:hypothetical protein LO771_23225 [Streptacidiphilus sp. ASG 303]|uniref:hypothetical protein n=1 Tax=Streptacidiphilus sp. ASG 303 TaxID=2896847 RepID=UPI001E5B2E5F|nr:hypothetical protein [Streptacidiphilus sp. ASG 303]MCD0485216.1 hypothetical protein [Streptacidiphilus sp. ASG 303]
MVTLLRILIDRRGLKSYDDFIREYEQAAVALAGITGNAALRSHTVSKRTFERWYSSSAVPQNDARRVLAHMFQQPITQLLAPAPLATATPPHVRLATDDDQRIDPRADSDADLHEMGRHAAMAARRAMEFAMGAERGEVGQETMAYLQDEVRRIAGSYIRVPLNHILDDLISLQDEAFRLLESGRTKPSQSRDLYLLAALSSGMLAKAGHDLGDPHSAMMQARTAAVCADKAEHQPLSAWVRGLQSLIAYWAGRPEDALHYAAHGASLAQGLRGSISVWLPSLQSRAAALLGDEETVTSSARLATDLRDRVEPDDLDQLGGLLLFPQIRQNYYQVEALALLGHGDRRLVHQAENAAQAFADTTDPNWSFGDAAGAQSNLALARLYVDDLEGAAEAIRPVLDLPSEQRNAGIIYSAHRVRSALSKGRSHDALVARRLSEEIATFNRPPLALPR